MSGVAKRFENRLRQVSRVVLDTSACIYYLTKEPARHAMVESAVDWAAERRLAIEIPGIVQAELLVKPLTDGSMPEFARVMEFTEGRSGVQRVAMTKSVLMAAARVRALTRLRMMDALVVGSAVARRCDAVIGNDRRFEVINGLGLPHRNPTQYIHLDDYITV